jgi:hypothetical protein
VRHHHPPNAIASSNSSAIDPRESAVDVVVFGAKAAGKLIESPEGTNCFADLDREENPA